MPSPILMRRIPGNVYPNRAANFVGANTQFLSIADNASLSMGAGVLMSMCCWMQPKSFAATQIVIAKTLALVTATHEYGLTFLTGGSGVLSFRASSGGAINNTQTAALTLDTWVFIAAYKDAANIGISVNNGAFTTASFAVDIQDSTQNFRMGAGGAGANPFTGYLDSVGLWKRVLTADEFTALYNGGIGMAYRDVPGAMKTSLISWWNLDDAGGSAAVWVDSHGTNHLTAGVGAAAPTSVTGKR